ncbi:MAG: hypothetical protein K1000chlam1_00795 [Candidatus Anoxychlamydiales bacterium]|nr:hypothetical protein [Candidatus Anoxychlamydiales bacterium]
MLNASFVTDALSRAQSYTFDTLPPLERLSGASTIFSNDQQLQFITLFACGIIGFTGGLISCCRSPGNFNSSAKSMTVSLLGAMTIAASYFLLGSSFNAPCPTPVPFPAG